MIRAIQQSFLVAKVAAKDNWQSEQAEVNHSGAFRALHNMNVTLPPYLAPADSTESDAYVPEALAALDNVVGQMHANRSGSAEQNASDWLTYGNAMAKLRAALSICGVASV